MTALSLIQTQMIVQKVTLVSFRKGLTTVDRLPHRFGEVDRSSSTEANMGLSHL